MFKLKLIVIFMLWKVVPFLMLVRNKKYRIVHCIEFEFICLHHREYKGTFIKYDIRNKKAEFIITSSYDHVSETMPYVGKKYFQNKESITFYEMVPQGQVSMEKRAYNRTIQSFIDGMIPPSFL